MTTKEKALQIVEKAEVVAITSVTDDGCPSSVVMPKLGTEEFSVFMPISASSAQADQFRANPRAALSIQSGHDCVSFTGIVYVATTKSLNRAFCCEWLRRYFSSPNLDPDSAVLQFVPQYATFLIDGTSEKAIL